MKKTTVYSDEISTGIRLFEKYTGFCYLSMNERDSFEIERKNHYAF